MSTRGPQPAGTWRHRRSRSLNGRALQLSAFALSFILVALLVVTSSRAAFVAQNDNVGNQVTAAAVQLADNDGTNAMFNVTGLGPGAPEVRCIQVTYTGNVDPTAVRLYRAAALTGDLAPYLDLTVEVGPAIGSTPFSGCGGFTATAVEYTGTLADFATNRTGYGSPTDLTTWHPGVTGETRTFRFTVSVPNGADAACKTTNFGFWSETRSS